jgi:hypothetical protein
MKIRMTDDSGHFWIDGKLYKLKEWIYPDRQEALKGVHQANFVEVDPNEYDQRVEKLAQRIKSFPQVDLLDIVRDALYDMSLNQLSRLEKKLEREEAISKEKNIPPRVETRRGERGTCVELRIGNKYGGMLRI